MSQFCFNQFLQTLKQGGLISHRFFSPLQAKGCSEKQIEQVKNCIPVALPSVYLAFLRAMGRSAGRFMYGSNVFYPHIFKLQTQALDLLAEDCTAPALPPNAFVFLMHQGYNFNWFLAGGSDDPEVWHFTEGMSAFQKLACSFTEYLRKRSAQEIELQCILNAHENVK